MRSLSPENQPFSLPPDLTALVLTLLEVGGVDSMTAETKTHFTEKFQEMLQLVVLDERNLHLIL